LTGQGRIVGVTDGAWAVEGGRIGFVERGAAAQPFRQVGVGQKRRAEGHRICGASGDGGVGLSGGVAHVGHQHPPVVLAHGADHIPLLAAEEIGAHQVVLAVWPGCNASSTA
jgi:hypothetical protein